MSQSPHPACKACQIRALITELKRTAGTDLKRTRVWGSRRNMTSILINVVVIYRTVQIDDNLGTVVYVCRFRGAHPLVDLDSVVISPIPRESFPPISVNKCTVRHQLIHNGLKELNPLRVGCTDKTDIAGCRSRFDDRTIMAGKCK